MMRMIVPTTLDSIPTMLEVSTMGYFAMMDDDPHDAVVVRQRCRHQR